MPTLVILGLSDAGKSTLARGLVGLGQELFPRTPPQIVKFSAPMKRFLESSFHLPEGYLETDKGRSALSLAGPPGDTWLDVMVRSAHHFRAVHPGISIAPTIRKLADLEKAKAPAIIDDCRYPNEVEALLEFGGNLRFVLVARPGQVARPSDEHLSENLAKIVSYGYEVPRYTNWPEGMLIMKVAQTLGWTQPKGARWA